MPDLMGHLLIGLIIAELFSVKKKSLVLLGAIMPDILSKMYIPFFYLGLPPFISFDILHTPAMGFLISILIAPLFRYERIKTLILVNAGLASHFIFDLTMKHFTAGQYLLFPFSMKFYTLNWIWPEQSTYILAASLLAYISIILFKKIGFEKDGVGGTFKS